jgi:purine-binding chemotaxis protein CheW
MSANLDKKMLSGFSREVKSYLPSIREGIEHFQKDSSQNEVLEDTLRYIHTIKGASALMGLAALSQIAAYIEDLLKEVMSNCTCLDEIHNQWLMFTIDQIDPYLECLLNGDGENQDIIKLIERRLCQIRLCSEEEDPTQSQYIIKEYVEDCNVPEHHAEMFEDSISSQEINDNTESNNEPVLPKINEEKDGRQSLSNSDSKIVQFLNRIDGHDIEDNSIVEDCCIESEHSIENIDEEQACDIVGSEEKTKQYSSTVSDNNDNTCLEIQERNIISDLEHHDATHAESVINRALVPIEPGITFSDKEYSNRDEDEIRFKNHVENIDDVDDHTISFGTVDNIDITQYSPEIDNESKVQEIISDQEDNNRINNDSNNAKTQDHELISSNLEDDNPQNIHIVKINDTFSDQEKLSETSIEASNTLEEIINTIDDSIRKTYQVSDYTSLETSTLLNTKHIERYLLFIIGKSYYAVTVTNILEIAQVPPITPVPNVPDWLKGIINLRGEMLSVIDLGHFFNVGNSIKHDDSRLLVVKTEGGDVVTSLVVDQVNGFIQLDLTRDSNISMIFHDKVTPYLGGIFELEDTILATLDLERLLHSPEVCQFY